MHDFHQFFCQVSISYQEQANRRGIVAYLRLDCRSDFVIYPAERRATCIPPYFLGVPMSLRLLSWVLQLDQVEGRRVSGGRTCRMLFLLLHGIPFAAADATSRANASSSITKARAISCHLSLSPRSLRLLGFLRSSLAGLLDIRVGLPLCELSVLEHNVHFSNSFCIYLSRTNRIVHCLSRAVLPLCCLRCAQSVRCHTFNIIPFPPTSYPDD